MGQLIFEEIGDPQCTEIIKFEELGAQGLRGESSYAYAIRTGMFVGTEAEFYSKTIDEPIAAAIVATDAAQLATQAAQNVGSAITDATNAATLANEKAILADNAAQYADDAAQLANQEAASATAAALAANNSATATDAAKDAANSAATNANDKAALANSASQSANTAASLANTAVTNANTARDSANTAAVLANTKAGEASAAAVNANNAAALAAGIANSKEDKIAVKNSAFNKNFGVAENDVMRGNAAKSFLAGMFNLKALKIFDSFIRPNSIDLGFTDSGHLLLKLKGTNSGILNNSCFAADNNINGVAIDIVSSAVRLSVVNIMQPLTFPVQLLYMLKDANNGLVFRITNQFMVIEKLVNGITTSLNSMRYIPNEPANTRMTIGSDMTVQADLIFNTDARVYFKQNLNPSIVNEWNVSNLFGSGPDAIFTNAQDLKYIGLMNSKGLSIFIS